MNYTEIKIATIKEFGFENYKFCRASADFRLTLSLSDSQGKYIKFNQTVISQNIASLIHNLLFVFEIKNTFELIGKTIRVELQNNIPIGIGTQKWMIHFDGHGNFSSKDA